MAGRPPRFSQTKPSSREMKLFFQRPDPAVCFLLTPTITGCPTVLELYIIMTVSLLDAVIYCSSSPEQSATRLLPNVRRSAFLAVHLFRHPVNHRRRPERRTGFRRTCHCLSAHSCRPRLQNPQLETWRSLPPIHLLSVLL